MKINSLIQTLFSLIISLTYIKNYNEPMPKLDPDLQKDLNLLDEVKNKTRIVACMVLIRNNIVHGQIDIGQTIKTSKHDRSKSFDKILASMIDHCDNIINDNEIINPDNILNSNSTHLKFMKFDEKIFQSETPLAFSEKELQILKILAESLEPEKEEEEQSPEGPTTQEVDNSTITPDEGAEKVEEVEPEPEEIIPNEVFGFDLNKFGIRTDNFTKTHYIAIGGVLSFLSLMMLYFVFKMLCGKKTSKVEEPTYSKPRGGKKKN